MHPPHHPSKVQITISSGTGPDEVQEFAGLLTDYLLERIEQRAVVSSVVTVNGNAPGLVKYAEIIAVGEGLLGELQREAGSHALVHKSTHREGHKRKRWFAGVTVEPAQESDGAQGRELRPEDIEVTACRSSGPGGQNVNKTSSRIRVKHLPTGVTVTCGDESSQHRNRQEALALLRRKLVEMDEEAKAIRGRKSWAERRNVERGNPVAVYRLEKGALVREDARKDGADE